jgi:hypothetical protein
MKSKSNSPEVFVKVPEKVLLKLIAAQVKGKNLFPEKVESDRKILATIKHK